MIQVIGRCSICGGDVGVHRVWSGVDSPRPKCARCGAESLSSRPVIQMRRDPPRFYTLTELVKMGLSSEPDPENVLMAGGSNGD